MPSTISLNSRWLTKIILISARIKTSIILITCKDTSQICLTIAIVRTYSYYPAKASSGIITCNSRIALIKA